MASSDRNLGLTADPLFVGATRPPMRWGVTYSALLFNMVFTMEVFLLTKNLLTLLLGAPIHGVCMLLCARDARSSTSRCYGPEPEFRRVRKSLDLAGDQLQPAGHPVPDSRGSRRPWPTAGEVRLAQPGKSP